MTIALKMTPLATHRGVPFFRHPIVFWWCLRRQGLLQTWGLRQEVDRVFQRLQASPGALEVDGGPVESSWL